jgi:hypothetical protein
MTEDEDDPRWGHWHGEGWIDFPEAVEEIVKAAGLSRGVAERTLRVLCGSGDVRSICCDEDFEEEPTIIKPEKWRETGELDLHGVVVNRAKWNKGKLDFEERWADVVLVSEDDLRHWLKKQEPTTTEPKQKSVLGPETSQGKQLRQSGTVTLRQSSPMPKSNKQSASGSRN